MPSQSRDDFYTTGRGGLPSSEARSFFIFNVPTFPAPLVAAELRVYAGSVLPGEGAVPFELHSVKAHPTVISNFSGSFVSNFNALAAGVVLGSRTIFGSQGRRHSDDPGAVISVPLNADGLSEVTVRQGDLIAFGGVVPQTNAPSLVFAFNDTLPRPPQLVLYFADAGAPEVILVEPGGGGEVLAGDRVNFAAVACGGQPMTLQWSRDAEPIPGATNEIFELLPLAAGNYRLIASNELGMAISDPVEIGVIPLRISEWTIGLWALDGEGDDTYLGVTVESLLPVEYQWRKHGANLPGETNHFLDFGAVTLQDNGEYDVVVSNLSGSRTSAVMTVTIEPRPLFWVDEPQTRLVAVGMPFELINTAFGSEPIHYQWYRNDQPIPGASTNFLRVSSAGFNDGGDYYLTAANPAGGITSQVHRVTIEPLVISPLPSEITGLWLNPFACEAIVSSSVPWTAQWYQDDESLPWGTNAVLSFGAFDHTNQGSYFLVASNIYGVATSTVTLLLVVTQEPWIWIWAHQSRVFQGEDAYISALAGGGPPPTVQWFFNDAPIGPPFVAEAGMEYVLPLPNVTFDRSGIYYLVATNLFGVTTSAPPMSLEVESAAPVFINAPLNTNEVAGNIVTLRAKAIAGPPPQYQWRKDGVDLTGETNSSLTLREAQPGDSGMYEIVASNELGQAHYKHTLRVSSKTGLDRWEWRLPRAQGSRLYQVVQGGGRYVATGKAGNIITSADGTNWTSVTIEADTDLTALAYGNGLFVAAGSFITPLREFTLPGLDQWRYLNSLSGLVLVSSNGTQWALGGNPEGDRLWQIAFGNGVFVASGYFGSAFCYVSTDGQHWVRRASRDRRIFEIYFGNDTFVAHADDGLYYSANGIDWTRSNPTGTFLIGFANGQFLALAQVNSADVLAESSDGRTWRELGPTPFNYPFAGLTGNGGAYVGLGNLPAGQVLYSNDRRTWLPVDTLTRQEIQSVIFADGKFLAVGEAGTVTRSINGLTWTPDEVANKIDFYGVTHGRGLHVAAGDAGTILTSSNGVHWVRRSAPTSRNLHAVTFANGLFVAGGRNGSIITSPDGANWTLRESGISNYVERIAWGDGLWVAVAEDGGISVSSNGLDWAGSSTGPPFTDHEGVAYGNGVWVVVGGYFNSQGSAVSTVYISTNGLRWSAVNFNLGKRLRDVSFGRGMFVAVGNDGHIALSSNGIGWTGFDIAGENLRRVTYANGRFVGVGNDGTLLSSANPSLMQVPWTKHRSRTSQNLHDVHAAPDGTFLYVGNNGMLLQSGNTLPRFLSINNEGWIEFDPGIAENLRLERSRDLKTWELDDLDVHSPMLSDPFGPSGYWRLVGD